MKMKNKNTCFDNLNPYTNKLLTVLKTNKEV